MKLTTLSIKNFRLLKDFSINFNEELSLIIGKNNSGKTSILNILDKLLNYSMDSRFTWEDINIEHQNNFINNFLVAENDTNEFIAIEAQLNIEYCDEDSYSNISNLMLDLGPDNNTTVIEYIVSISPDNLNELKAYLSSHKITDKKDISRYISKNFNTYFRTKRYSRNPYITNPEIAENKVEIPYNSDNNKIIKSIIKYVGVRADRSVSNDYKNQSLSVLTSKYFEEYKKTFDNNDDIFENLEQTLRETDKALYDVYNNTDTGIFKNIIETIKTYGASDQEFKINIESIISDKELLSRHTALKYSQGDENSLPETYNGLGYLNLIGILFEIEIKLLDIISNPADINIIYIEEPEAHTHPQLQYIFIRNIYNHINKYIAKLKNENNKNIQLIMTSHSSHIVSECKFDDIIYVKRENTYSIKANNFKELEESFKDNQDYFLFIKKYLTLNRCELFFSEKAICIEGATERILLPAMMKKLDEDYEKTPLTSQNISVIEVSGAYAHMFKPLFEFLGIKVLVITDIDPAGDDQKKCIPDIATKTSNPSIRAFFSENQTDISFPELTQKTFDDKVNGNYRIAYQIPEKDTIYQASSFEDAFLALNKKFILNNIETLKKFSALKSLDNNITNLETDNFYEFTKNSIGNKASFASNILFMKSENWEIPLYIKEGLEWIRE